MSDMLSIRSAMDVFSHAMSYILKYKQGIRFFEIGRLRGCHYDKPLWWETDSFQAIDVEPKEVIEMIYGYQPGPHLIGVVTIDPEGIVPVYAELGYKTIPGEPMETVMARNFKDFVSGEELHPVQLVQTEQQRQFYNSVIDADDPHGQMQPEELGDPALRYYYVGKDGKCVCNGKAILSFPTAVVVEPLWTHSDYRRRGIATALMNHLHTDAVKFEVTQSVIVASAMGVALYTTLGYKVIAYIQKFVPVEKP
jgi:ribosomal protein S18 acetylase RimI-like enzyme